MPRYERIAAQIDGDFAVFLIGARFGKWWDLPQVWRTARSFRRIVGELEDRPETGYLGGEAWSGRTTIMVQYWRSAEQLIAYARQRDAEHFPAWSEFNRRIAASGAVGIWHETYVIRAGEYECVYGNMPPFGLAKAASSVPIAGRLESALGRLGRSAGDDAPISVAGEVRDE